VLKAATDKPTSDTEAMELRLSEAIMKETPKLTSWLMFIKIVSVVAPLAGLLGTVLGMIETFQSITLFGAGDPKLMAGGISTALVTTVCGLVVAIPIVLLHTAAASKAKRVEEILEEQAAGMVARQLEK
jgi:biopolymer transport protein ExbB